VPGKLIEHVVEKWQAGTDVGRASSIQVEPQPDVGLARRAV